MSQKAPSKSKSASSFKENDEKLFAHIRGRDYIQNLKNIYSLEMSSNHFLTKFFLALAHAIARRKVPNAATWLIANSGATLRSLSKTTVRRSQSNMQKIVVLTQKWNRTQTIRNIAVVRYNPGNKLGSLMLFVQPDKSITVAEQLKKTLDLANIHVADVRWSVDTWVLLPTKADGEYHAVLLCLIFLMLIGWHNMSFATAKEIVTQLYSEKNNMELELELHIEFWDT